MTNYDVLQYGQQMRNRFDALSTDSLKQFVLHESVFPFITAVHALFICSKLKPHLKGQYWLFSLIISAIACVGGGTIASYLLCQHPSWLASNVFIPQIIAIWYLVNFSPFDIVYKTANFVPIQFVIVVIEAISKSRSMFVYIGKAQEHLPGSIFGAILIGSISGFGGTLIANLLLKLVDNPNAPSEFSKPTWASKSAFFATIFYCVATEPHSTLIFGKPIGISTDVIKLFIIAYLALHSAISTFAGPFTPFPINIVEYLFYFVTRIPKDAPDFSKKENPDQIKPSYVTKVASFSENSSARKSAPKSVGKKDQ